MPKSKSVLFCLNFLILGSYIYIRIGFVSAVLIKNFEYFYLAVCERKFMKKKSDIYFPPGLAILIYYFNFFIFLSSYSKLSWLSMLSAIINTIGRVSRGAIKMHNFGIGRLFFGCGTCFTAPFCLREKVIFLIY